MHKRNDSSLCKVCDGNGSLNCPSCAGFCRAIKDEKRYDSCARCHGVGKIKCPKCGGPGNGKAWENRYEPEQTWKKKWESGFYSSHVKALKHQVIRELQKIINAIEDCDDIHSFRMQVDVNGHAVLLPDKIESFRNYYPGCPIEFKIEGVLKRGKK